MEDVGLWKLAGQCWSLLAVQDILDVAVDPVGSDATELNAGAALSLQGGGQACPCFMELVCRLGIWMPGGGTESVCGTDLGWGRRGEGERGALLNVFRESERESSSAGSNLAEEVQPPAL